MKIVSLVFGSAVLIVALAAGGFWYLTNQQSTPATFNQTEQSTSATTQMQQPTQSSTLSVNDTNNTFPSIQNTPIDNQNQLPQPDSFTIYEEYANEQGTLFIDTQQGEGTVAATGDTVAMLYQGWLTDGTLFDQSRLNEDGQLQPFIFTLGAGQVIQGWEQGIVGMAEGGIRRLIIPSAAGYGEDGQSAIPPNAMLIFDVELLAVQQP